jgi:hypothetical protein
MSFRPDNPLKSGSVILLALLWFYMVVWWAFLVVSGEWLIAGVIFVPIIALPAYLADCLHRKQLPKLKPWLPWVARIMYVSIILAICDCWAAGTEHRAPLFSKTTWAMSDGGTRGSIGFGYTLTYYRRMGGVQGPEVWFWFTPFTVSWTTEHVGFRWIW